MAMVIASSLGAQPADPDANGTAAAATPSVAAGIFYDASKANAWAITGKIIFVTREGIFVKCARRSGESGIRRRKEGEVIFVRDPYPDLATFKALKTGMEVDRLGYSTGRLANKVGHGVPDDVRSFEIR